MFTGIVKKFTGTLLLLLIIFFNGFCQDNSYHPVRLMFYNVENLFDTFDDRVADDNEFLPGGERRWTRARYYNKINSIFKTIVAAGEWEPPDIAGLCEVENRKVVEDLVYNTNLARFNYGIIHEDSPDRRGIDVCMIYRKGKVDVLSYRYLLPRGADSAILLTRSVLYVKAGASDDTFHIFLNHWPSRRGGVLASEKLRFIVANMVREAADTLAAPVRGKIKIIMMGDFNSIPGDKVISTIAGSYGSGLTMVNLSGHMPAGTGTYRYLGTWEMIDQIFVSDFLLKGPSRLFTEPQLARIFSPDFLLCDDNKYPGRSPFSTYKGFKYAGGYSDHLPVILDLKVR